jgi:hypothetical protein
VSIEGISVVQSTLAHGTRRVKLATRDRNRLRALRQAYHAEPLPLVPSPTKFKYGQKEQTHAFCLEKAPKAADLTVPSRAAPKVTRAWPYRGKTKGLR